IELLRSRTGRACHLMQRGVDTELFSPSRSKRSGEAFVIGYAGRLSPEKDVRMLVEIADRLRAEGFGFRFLIAGEGSWRAWLREHLPEAEMPGVLGREALADAYARMDVFVFPSRTDTFGNVILEAMASGVPPIISGQGGPKYLVEDGVTGCIASDVASFV